MGAGNSTRRSGSVAAKMNISQRRAKLQQLINERREISINELNSLFDVSSVTLRNDLIYLERKGVCRRLFGKVVAECENSSFQLNYNYQKNLNLKERIGKYAAGLIESGDSVLFYAGTTTQQVARFVDPDISFIAVTNSIYIAQELRSLPKAKILFLGGLFSHNIGATYGAQAVQQIKEYNIDKLFLSVDGIDAQKGITNSSPFESDINQTILSKSRKVIVVADHTKVGMVSFIQMGSARDVDLLITDSAADEAQISALRAVPIEVITV